MTIPLTIKEVEMAIFDSNASGPLLRQFEAANEAEGVATRELLIFAA
jgi:hypothetical protein